MRSHRLPQEQKSTNYLQSVEIFLFKTQKVPYTYVLKFFLLVTTDGSSIKMGRRKVVVSLSLANSVESNPNFSNPQTT